MFTKMIPEFCKMSNNKYGHVDFLIFFSSTLPFFLQIIAKKIIRWNFWYIFESLKKAQLFYILILYLITT